MADSSHGLAASFWTQADALLRKNLTFQKRNIKSNIRLTLFPFLLCVLLVLIQTVINKQLDSPSNKCGCGCSDSDTKGDACVEECGIEYSSPSQAGNCPIPSPSEWPPVLQVPSPVFRAVQTDFIPYAGLPAVSCKRTGSCPATILVTGNNQSLGQSLAANMFSSSLIMDNLASNALGSDTATPSSNFLEPAFLSFSPLYHLQSRCLTESSLPVTFMAGSMTLEPTRCQMRTWSFCLELVQKIYLILLKKCPSQKLKPG